MPTTRDKGGVAVPSAVRATEVTSGPVQGRVRAPRTPATAARTPARRTKRDVTEPEPAAKGGALANELDRVLQISQPKALSSKATSVAKAKAADEASSKVPTMKTAAPPVTKPARALSKAPSKSTLKAGSSASGSVAVKKAATSTTSETIREKPSATSVRPTGTSTKTSTSNQAGPSRLPATTTHTTKSAATPSTLTRARPPAKAATAIALPEWAAGTTSLSSNERARAAMTALNTSQTSLSLAVRAGYRQGREAGTATASEETAWTAQAVEEQVRLSEIGVKVLRELDDCRELGDNAIEVEKAALGLVQRCMGLAMYDRAVETLLLCRPRLLRLYKATSAQPKSSSEAEGLTGRVLPAEWRRLLFYPAAAEGEQLGQLTRVLLFQAMMSAWTCILALRGRFSTSLVRVLIDPQTSSPTNNLHPLRLAVTLPRKIITPNLSIFSRFASAISDSSRDWVAAMTLAFQATALTITATPPAGEVVKMTLGQMFTMFEAKLRARIQAADSGAEDAAAALHSVVTWVENAVRERAEDPAQWFTGKSWMGLMDLWISLGRKLGKLDIIDQALSRMTTSAQTVDEAFAGLSIQPEAGPSTPRSSTPPSHLKRPTPARSGSSRRNIKKVSDAEMAVTRYCGELASIGVLLGTMNGESARSLEAQNVLMGSAKRDDELAIASVRSALGAFRPTAFSDTLASLQDDVNGKAAFEKASKALEVVRRQCDKLIASATRGEAADIPDELLMAARVWLVGAVDVVEDFVQSTPIDLETVPAALTSFASGAVDSLLTLVSHSLSTSTSTTSSTARAYLDRIHRLCLICRAIVPAQSHITWVRHSTYQAYHQAVELYKAERFSEAIKFAKIAADRSVELVKYRGEPDAAAGSMAVEVEGLPALQEILPRRWELLAYCSSKLQDYKTYFEATVSVFANFPPSWLRKLHDLSTTSTYREIWDAQPDLDALIRRLANPFLSHPESSLAYLPLFLDAKQVYPETSAEGDGSLVRALILEKWIEGLEKGLHTPKVVQAITTAAERILKIYRADLTPIRRMRVACRFLALVLQTGSGVERAEPLFSEIEQLSRSKNLGRDQHVAHTVPETRVEALVLRTLLAQRDENPSTTKISSLAREAMIELRQILLPPSKASASAPTSPKAAVKPRTKQPLGRATTSPSAAKNRAVSEMKTPKRGGIQDVRKVSDNIPSTPVKLNTLSTTTDLSNLPRLIPLLSSLIALLGLHGLTLQKIEALKIARALMRGHDNLLGDYVVLSARLGTEYAKLGKWTRASTVFAQARRSAESAKAGLVIDEKRIELGLRWVAVLAQMGRVDEAKKEYETLYPLQSALASSVKAITTAQAALNRAGLYDRAALARLANVAILVAEASPIPVTTHLTANFRLQTRHVEMIAQLGPEIKSSTAPDGPLLGASAKQIDDDDDPFSMPSASAAKVKTGDSEEGKKVGTGADEPAKDSVVVDNPTVKALSARLLSGHQWQASESFLEATFDLAAAYAARGSARDAIYFLEQAQKVAKAVKSNSMVARAEARMAQIETRMRQYESSMTRLDLASDLFGHSDNPDAVESRIIRGDLLEKRKAAEEALKVYKQGGEDIAGLDNGFGESEAMMPTPEKASIAVKKAPTATDKEQMLPTSLAHVLRQRLWLNHQHGSGPAGRESLTKQIKALRAGTSDQAEELYLDGRLALLEVLKVFKTDLFLSSLTDSTIALPMSSLNRRSQDRTSTRKAIHSLLARAASAFQAALQLMERNGRVEAVRQASMNLAMLCAFQASLGEGGAGLARNVADLLASAASITLRREMIENVGSKFVDGPLSDTKWPSIPQVGLAEGTSVVESDQALRDTWQEISARLAEPLLSSPTALDLSPIPPNWAIVSMSVAEDHSTMFLTRHQRDQPPLVLCLPLDRQGKREGEDNPLPFQAALDELRYIVDASDEQAHKAKEVDTAEGRQEWWAYRYELDGRMRELLANIEANWLGAFKSIFKSQTGITPKKIELLRVKLAKIFNEALAGTGTDTKKIKAVKLDDAVLACFATLDGSTNEEEVEDLVYFVLDVYGFHGIPVAISELDIDQIGVDVKQTLQEIDLACRLVRPTSSETVDHLFLVLDKNVQDFPWESIPVLRGRSISRIPSLPFLLDHLAVTRHSAPMQAGGRPRADARRVFYILNPSGDLSRTQTHFEPWIEQMKARAGWKGIVGRSPTDLEMAAALRDNDLVLYFGHGGAEQYIRSSRIRGLPRCATTLLWGCSSGLLKDQGDLDRTGTAWNYMMAGCPSLIANLWDVTDRDIDRLSEDVHKKLGLESSRIGSSSSTKKLLPLSEMSTAQALNASRDECRLRYLTGAAPVVYGLPVWIF